MERLAAGCARQGTILLIDEALGDFVEDSDSCVRLAAAYDNVVVTRSFSKAFGLAAERVGYAFFSAPLAEHYRQVDVPFEPGLLAATLARETLRDTVFMERVRRDARAAKAEIVGALREAGLSVLPTHPSVSILTAHSPGRDVAGDLRHGVWRYSPDPVSRAPTRAGTTAYCRLRITATPQVAELCARIRNTRSLP